LTCLSVACLLLLGTALAAPSITLSKKTGPPTSKILVSGSGFEPNVGVDIYFDTRDETLVVTDGNGDFQDAKIHAPQSALPGEHWVTALERNNDKGDQEPFVVFTNWPQWHFSPDNDGLNGYENMLSPLTVGNLTKRWSRSGGYSVFWNPAVVDGVVYTGSTDFNLYAVKADTGSVLWKYKAGSNIESSVTVADGIVYFGACDNNLYALNARTGKLLWKYTTGGCVETSPLVVNGVVYFGSDNFYALNAATGTLLWKYVSSLYIASSAAVANGVVCFGSGGYMTGGTVTALNARTGSLLWSYPSTNPVQSSPAISNGIVYVGSEDGYFYAFELMTGEILWKIYFPFSTSSPAVAYGNVYFGVDNSLLALDAASGKQVWGFGELRMAFGDSVVANGVVYVVSTGDYGGNLFALNARTGTMLVDYPIVPVQDYLGVTVANGVVYSDGYDLQAFSLPGADGTSTSPSDHRPGLSILHPDLTLQLSRSAARP